MKKMTLTAAAVAIAAITVHAQQDCDNAETLTVGVDDSQTVTVAPLSGDMPPNPCVTAGETTGQWAAWYSYTATQDVVVTVTTDGLGNDPADYLPVLYTYTGDCTELSCHVSDWALRDNDPTKEHAEVAFCVDTGETIYIVFDDLYTQLGTAGNNGFDFQVSTSTTFPDASDAASLIMPEDEAVGVPIEIHPTNGRPYVSIEWEAATTGEPATGYQIHWGLDDPANITYIGTLSGTNAIVYVGDGQGDDDPPGTTYYWFIVAENVCVEADPSDTWSFTTEEEVSVESHILSQVSLYPNPTTDMVNISLPAEVEITGATLYDILGKDTGVSISNGAMDISNLSRGVYMLNIETTAGNLTRKVVRK